MALPKVGEVIDGFRFKGGSPNDESSWEATSGAPLKGDIIDGYVYKGGDPNAQESWTLYQEPKPVDFKLGQEPKTPVKENEFAAENFKAKRELAQIQEANKSKASPLVKGAPVREDFVNQQADKQAALPEDLQEKKRKQPGLMGRVANAVDGVGEDAIAPAVRQSLDAATAKSDDAVREDVYGSAQAEAQTPLADQTLDEIFAERRTAKQLAAIKNFQATLDEVGKRGDYATALKAATEAGVSEDDIQTVLAQRAKERQVATQYDALGDTGVEGLYKDFATSEVGKNVRNFAGGTVGSAGATISYLGRKITNQTPEVGDAMIKWAEQQTPANPTLADKLVNAIGSSAAFYIPGLGVAAGTKALASLAPAIANWAGAGTMAGLEAAAEADGVYRERLSQGMSEKEAAAEADKTFAVNVALLGVTDKLAFFNDIKILNAKTGSLSVGNVVKKQAGMMANEGVQEGAQQVASNYFTGKENLMEGVGESALIGALAGPIIGSAGSVQQIGNERQAFDLGKVINSYASSGQLNTVSDEALGNVAKKAEMVNSVLPGTVDIAPIQQEQARRSAVLAEGSARANVALDKIQTAPDIDTAIALAGEALSTPLVGNTITQSGGAADVSLSGVSTATGLDSQTIAQGSDLVQRSNTPELRMLDNTEGSLGSPATGAVRGLSGDKSAGITASQPVADLASIPDYADPILDSGARGQSGVSSPTPTPVQGTEDVQTPVAAPTKTDMPDVGTGSVYGRQLAELNADLGGRADEIEQRTGQRPPTFSPATPEQERSFAPLAEALAETFGKPVIPFSDTADTAPDGMAYKGVSYVNIGNLDKAAPFVLAHEVIVHGNEQSKDAADVDVVNWAKAELMPLISEQGKKQYAEKFLFKNKGLTIEQVYADPDLKGQLESEMTADFFGKRAMDKQFLIDLGKRDPEGFGGFIQKWIGAIDGLIKSLKGKKALGYSDIDKHIQDLNKAKLIAQEAMIHWRKNAKERALKAKASSQATTETTAVQSAADQGPNFAKKSNEENPLPEGKESIQSDTEQSGRSYKLDITRSVRVEGARAKLSAVETAALSKASAEFSLSEAEIRSVTDQAIAIKKRFPVKDGWAPLELAGAVVEANEGEGSRDVSPKWVTPGYAFDRPPGAERAPAKTDQAWLNKVASEFTRLVKDVYERADKGDVNAKIIISHQTWYRNVAEVLRREFGGQGDLLADLLGATSPNTPVDTNWKFSIDILQRFMRGEFDKELSAFSLRLEEGGKPSTFSDANKIRQISGKLYGMNSINAMKALVDMWRVIESGSAPKARNFALNLIGQSNMATIDVWAARMLRRAANNVRGASFPRLAPPAEKGVTGKWSADASRVTGEFGFGAAVLDKVSENLAKDGVEISPPDLQALAWFAEKELWGKNSWTTVTGEGGSFEENIEANPAERYVAGFSVQKGELVPDDALVSTAQARVLGMLTGDSSVMAARVLPTKGLYGGTVESSFDAEWTVKKGEHDPSLVMAEIAKVAGENDQFDMFVSKVLGPNDNSPNARPGVEVYFKSEQALNEAQQVLDAFIAKGQDGFTMVVDPRAKNKDGYIGVRLQYVPEISMRWDEDLRGRLLADGGIESELQAKRDALDDVVQVLRKQDGVAFASLVVYDTVVVGKENYDEYIDRAAGKVDSKAGTVAWFGRPLREGLERAVARLQGERGQVNPGGVSPASSAGPSFSRKQDGPTGSPTQSERGVAAQVTGRHYSNAQRETLSGRFYGTGIRGAEDARLSQTKDRRLRTRLYFYVDEGKGVKPEPGVGKFAHDVDLENLYDTSTRTLSWEKDPYGDNGVTANNFESAVLDAGYSGYYRPGAFGTQGVAILLGDAAYSVKPKDAPQFSRKVPERTTGLVLANERNKASDSWGKHITVDHMRPVDGEVKEVGEKLNTLYIEAAMSKDAFDEFVVTLAEKTGTKAKTAPLKGRSRTIEKIMGDYNGMPEDMKDILRATIETQSTAQARQLFNVLRETAKIADVKGAIKSTLESGSVSGYVDAKVIIDVDGTPAELIIAPASLLRAKDLAHAMYEKQRSLAIKLKEATTEKERNLHEKEIDKLDRKMAEIYLPAAQRAQSSSASLREQGSALSRTVSMLNGLLSGSKAKYPPSTLAIGLPSKSQNSVPSGNDAIGDSIKTSSSNSATPQYSRKVDLRVKDWALQIKNRKPAKQVMLLVESPSEALNKAGIFRPVVIDDNHVRHIFNKRPNITADDVGALPSVVQSPRVAFKRDDGSVRLFVDGRDRNGDPLAVALNDLNVGSGKDRVRVTEVNTLFGNEKSGRFLVTQLLAGNVLYMRRDEIDRLDGLLLVTKLPPKVQELYSLGLDAPVPNGVNRSPTTSFAEQSQEVIIPTDKGEVKVRVADDALAKAEDLQFSRKQTDTPEFKRWFGDSKVVNADGMPLVVYHGSDSEISIFDEKISKNGFWFSADPGDAGDYGYDVTEAYLSIKNPAYFERYSGDAGVNAAILKAKADGHDGLIVTSPSYEVGGDDNGMTWPTNYVAFKPNQIKSATDNTGAFDPNNDDIRYARKDMTGSRFALPEETGMEARTREFQNDQVRWKNQIEAIQERGGKVTDENNVYQAMERMMARAMNRTQDFFDKNVTPVLKQMNEDKVTIDELGDYLYAKHAKERNARMREINPRFANTGYTDAGGSGMSDEQADQIIAAAEAKDNFAGVVKAANQFRAWAEANLDGLVEGGLLSAEQAEAMREYYPNYVPLKGFDGEPDANGLMGQGAGYSSAKNALTRALGRSTKAGNPAVYIIHGVAEGMMAREKSNVGRYLERLIQDNPDDALWTIGMPEKTQVMGRVGGEDQVVEMDMGFDPDKEVRFIRNGKQVRIQLKDPLLARAYNNRGATELDMIMQTSSSINAFLREMWTQKNPVFPFVNMIRDVPSGMLYATGEHGAAFSARMLRNVPEAWTAMWKQSKGQKVNGRMGKWVDEYRMAGGGIGFRMVSDLESTMSRVNRIQQQLGKATIAEALAKGDVKEAGKRLLWKTYNNAVTDFIEHVNSAFENMTRLAIYVAAREQDMSVAEAARLSKNATVNFNRKGEKSPSLNAAYLFSNAAIQDFAKNYRTVMEAPNRNQARAVLGAIASLGMALAVLGVGDDDDLEEENMHINNLKFRVGDTQVSIPLSYGLIGFSHYLGRSAGLSAIGEDVSTQSVRLASAMFRNMFPVNPIPNPDRVDGSNAVVGVMPTALSFPAEVFLNRTSFGSDMRPDYNDNPDAYKSFRGTRGSVYADIAAFMNEATGGTTRESGLIDVSPETIKGFVHFSLGGTGKFVVDTASTGKALVTDEEVNPNQVPLLNRFAKNVDVTTYRSRFYREAGEAREKMELFNKYRKDNNPEKRKGLAPWVLLGKRGNALWDQMNAIRDRELKIERDENLTAKERQLKLDQLATQQIRISDQYHALYKHQVEKSAN